VEARVTEARFEARERQTYEIGVYVRGEGTSIGRRASLIVQRMD
jgi:hypothetical protein